MGTRFLTMVTMGGTTKVAQFGQFDGHPQGRGKDILEFLRDSDMSKFMEQLTDVSFLSLDEYRRLGKKEKAIVDSDSKILQSIYQGKVKKLYDSSDFAKDSLWCEWAYVIDLDKETFEVFKGSNNSPLSCGDRFYDEKDDDVDKEYYPVKIVRSYFLKHLPVVDQFLKDFSSDKSKNVDLFIS